MLSRPYHYPQVTSVVDKSVMLAFVIGAELLLSSIVLWAASLRAVCAKQSICFATYGVWIASHKPLAMTICAISATCG